MKSDRGSAEMLLRIAQEDQKVSLLLADQGSEFLRQTFFHAQQAVEKALKAVLASRGHPVRKTHDLMELYGSLESVGLSCPLALDELDQLSPYAAMFRYDDTDIPRLDMDVARATVTRIIEWAVARIEESDRP